MLPPTKTAPLSAPRCTCADQYEDEDKENLYPCSLHPTATVAQPDGLRAAASRLSARTHRHASQRTQAPYLRQRSDRRAGREQLGSAIVDAIVDFINCAYHAEYVHWLTFTAVMEKLGGSFSAAEIGQIGGM
jgi:hypothetical protein